METDANLFGISHATILGIAFGFFVANFIPNFGIASNAQIYCKTNIIIS
jgi:hypothetical protein